MKEQINNTLKIEGYSEGDSSVGIGNIEFTIDTGLYPEDVTEDDREFIINNIIKNIWELHDNGDIRFDFSDELNEFGYTRGFGYKNIKEKENEK
ncbi:MAG: hypothetical protein KKF56_05680 [Nanoarchaeota archaeon]|nr:hypothetical protein [Nanoarchaeota archaeon]